MVKKNFSVSLSTSIILAIRVPKLVVKKVSLFLRSHSNVEMY